MGNICCVAETQPQGHPSSVAWLHKIFEQLSQPSLTQETAATCNLHQQLSSSSLDVYNAHLLHPGSSAGAHCSLQLSERERIVATIRSNMKVVKAPSSVDMLKLTKADLQAIRVTDTSPVKAQAGFAGSSLSSDC